MLGNSKKTIEKNPDGEYVFTPYGEFLSYFHAHLEIFKRFYKFKNFPESKLNKDLPALKSFMAANIKNVDQYFPNIPKYAEIMGVSTNELSGYLNQNFLEVLPRIQERFKKSEIQKLQSTPALEYERITEEILEKTGFSFPAGKRFVAKGNLVVLEDIATGEIVEPRGLMAGLFSPPPPPTSGIDPGSAPIPQPNKAIEENSILEEIVNLYGEFLTGAKLEVKREEISDQEESEPARTQDEGILEDIEDLEFHMEDSEDLKSDGEAIDTTQDSMSSMFGIQATARNEREPELVSKEVQNFTIREYFEILKRIVGYQAKKDAEGYKNYLESSPPYIRAVISIRNFHNEEIRNQPVNWNLSLESIGKETQLSQKSLLALKDKVIFANWVRIGLDRGISEFKKGSPEFVEVVRRAWPGVQEAFSLAPDYDSVLERLKGLVSKIGNPEYRKEIVRVLSMVLKFVKQKT